MNEAGPEKLVRTARSVERERQNWIVLQSQLVEEHQEVNESMITVTGESAADRFTATTEECEWDQDEAGSTGNDRLKVLNTLCSEDTSQNTATKSSPDSAGVVPKAVCILNGVKPVRTKYDGEKTGDNCQPSVGEMIVRMSPSQPLQTCDKDDTPVPAGDASVAVGIIASLNAVTLDS